MPDGILFRWVDGNGEPASFESAVSWEDSDVIARSKEFWDPSTEAWYWADADGTIARNKDVYLRSNGGKWVRYDENGHMVKGEDYRYGAWYYFDYQTGAMAKGVNLIKADDSEKWVYYDVVTGKMAHGEAYLSYDRAHTGWYYFDPYTGEMDHEWAWIPTSNKWVYYDKCTGIMQHGSLMIDGKPYYLDQTTGEKLSHQQCAQKVLNVARSRAGIRSADNYIADLRNAGGSTDPYGPCMTFVWWCYQQAGEKYQLLNGFPTGWPHDAANWFSSQGRLKKSNPQPGDVWLVNQPVPGWGPIGASATHAGIVDHAANGRVYVWQHIGGRVQLIAENPNSVPWSYFVGYGNPNMNDD